MVVTATNLGDASASPEGSPIVLKDSLPSGLKPVAIEGYADEFPTAQHRLSPGMLFGSSELYFHWCE